jgi:hypothetical protein
VLMVKFAPDAPETDWKRQPPEAMETIGAELVANVVFRSSPRLAATPFL